MLFCASQTFQLKVMLERRIEGSSGKCFSKSSVRKFFTLYMNLWNICFFSTPVSKFPHGIYQAGNVDGFQFVIIALEFMLLLFWLVELH